MASLPSLPTIGRRAKPAATAAASVDAKLTLARRLHAEDQARRATSIAPPGARA